LLLCVFSRFGIAAELVSRKFHNDSNFAADVPIELFQMFSRNPVLQMLLASDFPDFKLVQVIRFDNKLCNVTYVP